MVESFPARELIRGWLKAGVFEPGKGFAPTEEGTPQGGVISPLLLNVALHGLEEAAGVRYAFPGTGSGETKPGSPVVIRYADDLSVGIEVGQPTVSHHLKVLRTAGLLASERRGSWVYYRVIPEALHQLSHLLGTNTLTGSR